MKPHTHYIYTFTDPTNDTVIYVGRSKQTVPNRFVKHLAHLKCGGYVRNPFKCKLQALYNSGVSYDTLLKQFSVLFSGLSEQEAILQETKFINEVYGIDNLLNICTDGTFGGDTFTNHPNKEQIRTKLKGRIPWNKGTKGVCKSTKTSYKKDIPRITYILISPAGDTYNIIGTNKLKEFCNQWKRDHNAISVKDENWISPTAFQLGTTLKGWSVSKITLEDELT
jgi:hypothetical protein